MAVLCFSQSNIAVGPTPHGKRGPALLRTVSVGIRSKFLTVVSRCVDQLSTSGGLGARNFNRSLIFASHRCLTPQRFSKSKVLPAEAKEPKTPKRKDWNMSAYLELKQDCKANQRRSWVKRLDTSPSPDTDLAAAATEAIAWLTTVPQETITVTAHNGWLHLEGKVNYRHQRAILEDVTRHLPGVRGVTDSIMIEAAIQ